MAVALRAPLLHASQNTRCAAWACDLLICEAGSFGRAVSSGGHAGPPGQERKLLADEVQRRLRLIQQRNARTEACWCQCGRLYGWG